jgi:hypothetical protein
MEKTMRNDKIVALPRKTHSRMTKQRDHVLTSSHDRSAYRQRNPHITTATKR